MSMQGPRIIVRSLQQKSHFHTRTLVHCLVELYKTLDGLTCCLRALRATSMCLCASPSFFLTLLNSLAACTYFQRRDVGVVACRRYIWSDGRARIQRALTHFSAPSSVFFE
jgi:hypothetical protein